MASQTALKAWLKKNWHWVAIAAAAGVAAIYLYTRDNGEPEQEPEGEGLTPNVSPTGEVLGGSVGGGGGAYIPSDGFITNRDSEPAVKDEVPTEDGEPVEGEPELHFDMTDEIELQSEPITGGGFKRNDTISAPPQKPVHQNQTITNPANAGPSISPNKPVAPPNPPPSIAPNRPAPAPQKNQAQCNKARNEINRLQGEINNLQGDIARLTNWIQAHPRAQQRGRWEAERNQARANIDHKRGNVNHWHGVARREC